MVEDLLLWQDIQVELRQELKFVEGIIYLQAREENIKKGGTVIGENPKIALSLKSGEEKSFKEKACLMRGRLQRADSED